MASTYTVQFSSFGSTPDKHALTIPPGDINTDTSLTLPGQGKTDYGQFFDENLLHLLENFASLDSPSNPTTGQLWYNLLDSRLRYYVGITTGINNLDINHPGWIVIKTITGTIPTSPICGETYYNISNDQFLVYNCTLQVWQELAWLTTSDNKYISKSGGTMTGLLTLSGIASLDYNPVAKIQFDQSILALTNELNIAIGAATAGLIPSGTIMLFAQSAAPNGWTQDITTAANNRMLRVVSTVAGTTGSSGTGGYGYGGSADPTIMNVVPSHTHSFTTGTESGTHGHAYDSPSTPYNNAQGVSPGSVVAGSFPISTGIQSQTHYHSGSTDNGSSQTNWSPKYLNIIVCTKN